MDRDRDGGERGTVGRRRERWRVNGERISERENEGGYGRRFQVKKSSALYVS